MQLSGGKGIGGEGVVWLAGLLQRTPPDGLEELELRCIHPMIDNPPRVFARRAKEWTRSGDSERRIEEA